MTTKSKGESIRQKLTTLSIKKAVKYSNLETVFLIERPNATSFKLVFEKVVKLIGEIETGKS